MGQVKEINIKNETYYFFNEIITIDVFDPKLLKLEKKSYKNIDIYYMRYITINKMDVDENIYSVNPLYLIIREADGHIEEKSGSKYLVFNSTDENRKSIKKHAELWDGIKNKTGTINVGKNSECIRFHKLS